MFAQALGSPHCSTSFVSSPILRDMAIPPPDHFLKESQFTETIRTDTYPAIDPTRPEHSQAGKVIIVTGATQGIGKAIALAFATAGAAALVLFSRTASKLAETKAEIHTIDPAIEVVTVAGDTTVQADVDRLSDVIKETFGFAHVLVNAAGLWKGRGTIKDTPADTWFRDTEVNNKGTYMIMQAFLRLLGTSNKGTIINLSSFGCDFVLPGASSYLLSKFFMNRLTEFVALENPNVTAICCHPGSVATSIFEEHQDMAYFANDTMDLAAQLVVYLATERANFLNGRYMSANWDVTEVEAKKGDIIARDLLKFSLRGEIGRNYF